MDPIIQIHEAHLQPLTSKLHQCFGLEVRLVGTDSAENTRSSICLLSRILMLYSQRIVQTTYALVSLIV